ncbi:thioesterase family protein [Anoxybacillus geothermalis]|jgi:acyl-CoA thioester hydrolase|uniref:acyl-CoA thioesterase n=1 Tax=Geobacillus sp. Sah69 TaxID=1737624 RepID=UPI000503386B|nr:thioesterase family protein [Geobacillus sp. Sah69]AKM19039.1 acyl-CoA thioesterase YbgC [Geobacillus sp. 12AMOR1]KFL15342.1 thioesterase [Geobacillus stearothermophilus]MED4877996.1 thioesterase family protein [Anoxybacillus geothermalis]KFX32401.1 thioesterase [Geobacillus stearothermophilus]KQC46147.1 thioesterase [Geobacillus sp. Sah69]
MKTHTITVNPRFCETDALGHLSNISYFIYLEEARTRLFDELSYGGRTDEWHFILASTKCDFIRQAFFGRRLRVETNVSRIGNKSFQCIHRIVEEETGTLIALGEAVVVHFNFHTQTSEPLPDELRARLAEYLVSTEQAAPCNPPKNV